MLLLASMYLWMVGLLVALFLLVSVVLILTILIQKPSGGGLSGAFGSGAGSGQTAFGTKTGDALTIATIAMFAIYLVFAVVLNFMTRPSAPVSVTPAATSTEVPGTDGESTGAADPSAAVGGAVPAATGPGAESGSATPGATGATGGQAEETWPGPAPVPAGGAEGGAVPAVPGATGAAPGAPGATGAPAGGTPTP